MPQNANCFGNIIKLFLVKGEIIILKITKEECEEIREKFPHAHIAIANRFKKACRRHYYVEELGVIKAFLTEKRGCVIDD